LCCLLSNKGFLRLLWLFAHRDGFVCVAKTIIIILTFFEYAKELEAPSECVEYGGAYVNCVRTLQGGTAVFIAAEKGRTACVQALLAAKAAPDIKTVSAGRLLPCPVPLESPSASKLHKHLLKLGSCTVACVYEHQLFRYCRLYLDDCAFILRLHAY
jgi:hypothetical protein